MAAETWRVVGSALAGLALGTGVGVVAPPIALAEVRNASFAEENGSAEVAAADESASNSNSNTDSDNGSFSDSRSDSPSDANSPSPSDSVSISADEDGDQEA